MSIIDFKNHFIEKLSNLDKRDYQIIILLVLLLIIMIFAHYFRVKYINDHSLLLIVNDSISYYKNKIDEEYIAKNTYILENTYLKLYNQELYNEYTHLKEHPLIITQTQIETKFDTIYTTIDSLILNDDYIMWCWSANDSTFYKISGESYTNYTATDVKTIIEEISINTGITLDIIDDGALLKVIARSDNPYIGLNDINSVIIDPEKSKTLLNYYKPKKWGFGPYIGVGIGAGIGAGFNSLDVMITKPHVGLDFSIGVSIHYSWLQW